jgi:uncharacterized protein YbjT (DUF2867 family)
MILITTAGKVGAEAARLLAGRTYWPTGPEAISYAGAAEALSTVLGRTITFRRLTFEDEKEALVGAGLPESVAVMNAQAMALFAEGDSDYVSDDVASVLGRPPRSFHQFATDYATAFS